MFLFPSNLYKLKVFSLTWSTHLANGICQIVLFPSLVISCIFFFVESHSVPSFADVDLYKWCLFEFDYFHFKRIEVSEKALEQRRN